MMMKAKLTPRKQRFLKSYLAEANGNATEAAKRAGYSERTAYSQGSRLLKDVEVQKAIQRHLGKLDVSTDDVLENIADLATTKPSKVTAGDVVSAGKLFLQAKGALQLKPRESGVIVRIGFLQQPSGEPTVIDVAPKPAAVMSSQALVPANPEEPQ